MAKQLIFVSGVGDSRYKFYDQVARHWKIDDFTPHAFIFGWDDSTTDFDVKFKRFLDYLDNFSEQDEFYLVGISAGGTTVVNAMSARPNIKKIVMVSSPFVVRSRQWNPVLITSIEKAQEVFKTFDDITKAKMLTITGWRDNIVPTRLSILPGVRKLRVFGLNHTMSIVFATLIAKRPLRHFLAQG